MFGVIIVLAVVVAVVKISIRNEREQRNIQIAVEKALEEERKKRAAEEENCSK